MTHQDDRATAHVITDVPERRPSRHESTRPAGTPAGRERVALVDLLDRVLATGVVVVGDVTLSLADVDMVTISVRALISSASSALTPAARPGPIGTPGYDA
jgi:Gas vesicle protein